MGWWRAYFAGVGRALFVVATVVASAALINLVSLPVDYGLRHLSGRRFTGTRVTLRVVLGLAGLGVLFLVRRAARPLS